jgi:hypothetical protein
MHTVGASNRSADLALASVARCSPIVRKIDLFQVAAKDVPQGNRAACLG